jgi:pyruvate/2-oxoglutarate dehydrogenase complex dihydrolipoamide acyltransferase (E2) component
LDSPVEGLLLKIPSKEGAEVPVGDPVCQIGQAHDAIAGTVEERGQQ